MMNRITIFCIASIVVGVNAAGTSDFLVVSSPGAFSILDQYEQTLSDTDRRQLPDDLPLQLVSRDETLGDQITHAIRCSFMGKTFYIMKDEKGNPVKTQKTGVIQTFRSCRIVNDTMLLSANSAITGISSRQHTLTKGTPILRIFLYGGRFYCFVPGTGAGWCSGPFKAPAVSSAVSTGNGDIPLTPELRERIFARIKAANESYRACFDYFNRTTGNQKLVPSWSIEDKGKGLICRLSGHYAGDDMLAESTRYLVQNIENFLIGKPFNAVYLDGEIRITPKVKSEK